MATPTIRSAHSRSEQNAFVPQPAKTDNPHSRPRRISATVGITKENRTVVGIPAATMTHAGVNPFESGAGRQ
ncbi:hypothetical protein GCM10010156_34800 [Planobispora rosea]|nr:hypothetical protein GCM10010156_34800 [Planobispora rosea]